MAVGAVLRLCTGIAATATLCAAAGDEKRPVFLALGPKAAEMRQSPGDLVLAFVSLLACSFTVLGYALSSFSTPLPPLPSAPRRTPHAAHKLHCHRKSGPAPSQSHLPPHRSGTRPLGAATVLTDDGKLIEQLQNGDTEPLMLALPIALGVGGLQLLHEVGHLLAALRSNVKIGFPVAVPSLQARRPSHSRNGQPSPSTGAAAPATGPSPRPPDELIPS